MSRKTSLLKASSLLFTGGMLSNVCNYLFHVFMGRMLSVEDYGILNSLVSLYMITSVPSVTITLVMAKYCSEFMTCRELDNISGIFYVFLKTIFLYVGMGYVLFLFISPYISNYLNIPSIIPVVIIGTGLFFAFFAPVNNGVLQGLQRFTFLSVSMAAVSLFKLFSAVVLVYMGFKVNGALAALALASFFVFLLTAYYLRRGGYVVPLSRTSRLKLKADNGIIKYSLPILFSSLLFAVLTQVDMLLVKHYFPAQQAGIYASAAVFGRTVLCLPSVIVIALFPLVSELHCLNKDTFEILKKGLLYTGLIAGGGVLLFWSKSELLLRVMFGERFVSAAPLLGVFGLAMFPLALLSIVINFNLARHQTKFLYSILGGVVLQVVLIHFYHNSLEQVLWIMAGIGGVLFVCNFIMILCEKAPVIRVMRTVEE